MKTGKEYIESLRKLKPTIYYMGKKVDSVVDHPGMRPHVNSAAMTYGMAFNPQYEDLMTVTSHLTEKKISRFAHIPQNTADLTNKVKMLRAIAQNTGTCFQRCVGMDGLIATYSVTYEIDAKMDTDYHKRFIEYLNKVQDEGLMVAGAMTDPKGDRSLPPSKQSDPDLYVHVVEKRKDGIIVRGAKAHITGAVNSHEILAMPTNAMSSEDADYAVTFAVPVDAPGVVLIFGRQSNDTRKEDGQIDQGNFKFGIVGGEALIVFKDVFVPWERVFMCGEYEFAGILVERFATYHRQNYGGCKTGVSDVLIGATTTAAQYQGTDKAAHVRDKLAEMIHLTETLYAGSLACSNEGYQLPSGQYFPDPLLANITKLNTGRFMYEISRIAHDITGGLIATMPSEKDMEDPEVGQYITKYLKGNAAIPAIDRIRILRLIENMTSGTALAEAMHGAGSPQAQKIMILRQANLDNKKRLSRRLAGIETPPDPDEKG